MSLAEGVVLPKDDLGVYGMVEKVGPAKLSKKGVYHSIALELKGQRAGFNGTFYLSFMPHWFRPEFDPHTGFEDLEIAVEHEDGTTENVFIEGSKMADMYRRHIANKQRNASLQALLGATPNGFANLARAFDELGDYSAESIGRLLQEYLTGVEVIYVLQQRKDEDGELMEAYNVGRFFPATEEGEEAIRKSQASSRRKTPLVLTWDEE